MSSTTSEEERNRISDIHEYGVDVKHRYIYVQGVADAPMDDFSEPGVEYRMANRLIKNLDVLQGLDEEKPIVISMKTCGGDWVEGMAMYDAILANPCPITIINWSHARSMSSIILQAANKRIMAPHSYFMIHEGTDGFEGTVKSFRSYAEFGKVAVEQMLDIYVDCLKRAEKGCTYRSWSQKRIREMLIVEMAQKEEVYFTAEQAVIRGFADEVFSGWGTVTDYTETQKARK
jgi:ATP-dependent protease ClpP protease subunit